MPVIDVEEIHTVLKGLTRVRNHLNSGKYIESEGAEYSLTVKWFKQCGIIDAKVLPEEMLVAAYERVAPNREDLSLIQMITIFGILSRETHLNIDAIAVKFEDVKDEIIDEIRTHWREVEKNYKPDIKDLDDLESEDSDGVIGKYVTF